MQQARMVVRSEIPVLQQHSDEFFNLKINSG
eukprot:CAMPEP_0171081508 /NCGR_PEP_ID=MMETSP0766_2-20121228/16541_1 /TAXON_ID=439317 /ORGANISM="Gambierdiscus australes, Strain CAWD 149" /LENGTH=30 /DNA_ID= /DNA_START= /DNA_END= /DNA_ORIENTATION=